MKKRTIWQRIKWGNVSLLVGCLAVVAAGSYGITHHKTTFDWAKVLPKHVVTYSYRIQAGDTLWDVASDIALPQDDLRHMIWQIMEDNNIKDPGAVQPGTEITIYVDPAKANIR